MLTYIVCDDQLAMLVEVQARFCIRLHLEISLPHACVEILDETTNIYEHLRI